MGWTVRNIFHALLLVLLVVLIEAGSEVKFVPSHYKIDILTEKDHFESNESQNLTYTGTVTIFFEKSGNTEKNLSIVLNSHPKSNIKSAALKCKISENTTKDIKCEHKLHNDKLIFDCEKDDPAFKEFQLTIKYSNPFGDDMSGFYRSSYVDSQNKTRWLLTTHFEPIFARNAFPCFDEPRLKATFQVSLTAPKTVTTVLSNTQLEKKTENNNEATYIFKKTDIPMSTYLVAFTASNLFPTEAKQFESNYENETGKKEIRTYGREDIIKNKEGEFAQIVGKEALELLTKYLKMGYAFKKVDQVGIPDFSAGAMENFGHISFREKSLFYNKNSSTTMTKQSNLLTIVHELVHQWFGNLVTLESWDYIWLNEAFATYLEYIISSQINTKEVNTTTWNLMNQMVVNEIQLRAFEADGLITSKPLTQNNLSESLVYSSFNDIPYCKGGAVLRMWDLSFDNADKFRDCLRVYINNRKENSTKPKHLFDALKTANLSKEVFYNWTTQAGYPVVEVRKMGDGTYNLTQSRFLWEKENSGATWVIPITFSTSTSLDFKTVPKVWLEGKSVTLTGVKGDWIIVNNQQAGYYRVNYEEENWEALSKFLLKDFQKVPEINRAQIVDDVFSLARSLQKKYVDYATAFNLGKYLKNEVSFLPLKTALHSFDFLRTKLESDNMFEKFKDYVLQIIKPHFTGLNIAKSEHLDKLKKVEVSRWACSLDYEACLNQAKGLYNSKNYTMYPDVQEIVLCTAARTVKTAWDEIKEKYKEEQDSASRIMYLRALGCTSDTNKATQFLESTLSKDSDIRKQDLMFVLSAVYNGNYKNLEVAFKFVERNFTEIAQTYGGINPLGRAIVGIARKVTTKDQCQRLEKLVKKVKDSTEVKGAEESLDNAVQIASSNCKWFNEKRDQLKSVFGAGSLASYSLGLLFLCLLFVLQF